MIINSQFFITYYTGKERLPLKTTPPGLSQEQLAEYNRFIQSIGSIYGSQNVNGKIPKFWTKLTQTTNASIGTQYAYAPHPDADLEFLEPKSAYYFIVRDESSIPLKIPSISGSLLGFTNISILPSVAPSSLPEFVLTKTSGNVADINPVIQNLQPYEEYDYSIKTLNANWPVAINTSSGTLKPSSSQSTVNAKITFPVSLSSCNANLTDYTADPSCLIANANLHNKYATFVVSVTPKSYVGPEIFSDQFTIGCRECLPIPSIDKTSINNITLTKDTGNSIYMNHRLESLQPNEEYIYVYKSLTANWPVVLNSISGVIKSSSVSGLASINTKLSFPISSGVCSNNIEHVLDPSCLIVDINEHNKYCNMVLSVTPKSFVGNEILSDPFIVTCDDCLPVPKINTESVSDKTLNKQTGNHLIISPVIENLQPNEEYSYVFNVIAGNHQVYFNRPSGIIKTSSKTAKINTDIMFNLENCGEPSYFLPGILPNTTYENTCSKLSSELRDKYVVVNLSITPKTYSGATIVSDSFLVKCDDCVPVLSIKQDSLKDITLSKESGNNTVIRTSIDNMLPNRNYTYRFLVVDANWPVVLSSQTENIVYSVNQSGEYPIETKLSFPFSTGQFLSPFGINYSSSFTGLGVPECSSFAYGGNVNTCFSDSMKYNLYKSKYAKLILEVTGAGGAGVVPSIVRSDPFIVTCDDCLPKPVIEKISDISLNKASGNRVIMNPVITNLQPDEEYTYTFKAIDSNWPTTISTVSGTLKTVSPTGVLQTKLWFAESNNIACGNIFGNNNYVLPYTIEPSCLISNSWDWPYDKYTTLQLSIRPKSFVGSEVIGDPFTLHCEDCLPKPSAILTYNVTNKTLQQSLSSSEVSSFDFGLNFANLETYTRYLYNLEVLDAQWPTIFVGAKSGILDVKSSTVNEPLLNKLVFCYTTGSCPNGAQGVNPYVVPNYPPFWNKAKSYSVMLRASIAPQEYPLNIVYSDPVIINYTVQGISPSIDLDCPPATSMSVSPPPVSPPPASPPPFSPPPVSPPPASPPPASPPPASPSTVSPPPVSPPPVSPPPASPPPVSPPPVSPPPASPPPVSPPPVSPPPPAVVNLTNFANYNRGADWVSGQDGYMTTVGTNGGPSAYGTYDQTGNLSEWTDTDNGNNIFQTNTTIPGRIVRGSSYISSSQTILTEKSSRSLTEAVGDFAVHGFRVASRDNPLGLTNFVIVGNPNNPADSTGYGQVNYFYYISKYLVTCCEYVEFLNAVAAYVDLDESLDKRFRNHPQISRSGLGWYDNSGRGSFRYSVKPNFEKKPVLVSWIDAVQYCNWLHVGKRIGTSDTPPGLTAAYTAPPSTGPLAYARETGAKYHIPTENEWYKAAYYKGSSGGYWNYATQSNTVPTPITANSTGDGSFGATSLSCPALPQESNNNYANFNAYANWGPLEGLAGKETTVGTNGGPSAYGTYDQAGNAWEIVEPTVQSLIQNPSTSRVLRLGGSFRSIGRQFSSFTSSEVARANAGLQANTLLNFDIHGPIGFRIATFTDPSSAGGFVTVNNPSNQADVNGYGSVTYSYQIGKYLVTNRQYADFLISALSIDSDNIFTYADTSAGSTGTRRIIRGPGPNFSYTVVSQFDNKPATYITFWDAARYCNWLHNNKPTRDTVRTSLEAERDAAGLPNFAITELSITERLKSLISTGAYSIPSNWKTLSAPIGRNTAAKYWIPNINEWYKAAYYKAGGINAGYWAYPTQSDITPKPVSATITGDGDP